MNWSPQLPRTGTSTSNEAARLPEAHQGGDHDLIPLVDHVAYETGVDGMWMPQSSPHTINV